MTHMSSKKLLLGALAAISTLSLLAGCSAVGGDKASADSITLVTHDSFAMSKEAMDAFTKQTGITVTQVAPGDGGALVNQLVLTKDSPLGDVVFGVSDTFASRAIDEGVFAPYKSKVLPASAEQYLIGDKLTPIDYSDVCLNIDKSYFANKGLEPPVTLDDITKPEYKDLTVVTNPATSSPGLNFLMTTIAAKGNDGWIDYWKQLKANGLKVADGWNDAYNVDFTGASDKGDRPIVLSYSSSPPYTVGKDGQPTTAALLDTCSRQVEYAGVLAGAKNPEGAKKFIDFMLGNQFQSELPEQMYVYPIDSTVPLQEDWAKFAPVSPNPFKLDPKEIDKNRAAWIEEWSSQIQD